MVRTIVLSRRQSARRTYVGADEVSDGSTFDPCQGYSVIVLCAQEFIGYKLDIGLTIQREPD